MEKTMAFDETTPNEPEPTPQEELKKSPYKPRKIPEHQLRNAFCTAKALARFPYKYMYSKGSDLCRVVSKQFFDAGRIWNRIWDL